MKQLILDVLKQTSRPLTTKQVWFEARLGENSPDKIREVLEEMLKEDLLASHSDGMIQYWISKGLEIPQPDGSIQVIGVIDPELGKRFPTRMKKR